MMKLIDQLRTFLPFNGRKVATDVHSFTYFFRRFQHILTINNRVLELIAEANDACGGNYIFDRRYIETVCQTISDQVLDLVNNLEAMAPGQYQGLNDRYHVLRAELEHTLNGKRPRNSGDLMIPYDQVIPSLFEDIGEKNANLATLHNHLGLRIPDGFCITGTGFQAFLEHNNLEPTITTIIESWKQQELSLEDCSKKLQNLVMTGIMPGDLQKELTKGVALLKKTNSEAPLLLAVRSSAWGEDGDNSFAGQYQSVLNVPADKVVDAYRQVLCGSYSPHALMYRQETGFEEHDFTMAVACQVMIDVTVGGVLYTLDPNDDRGTGMLVTSTRGHGASIVSGKSAGNRFILERQAPHRVREVRLEHRDAMAVRNISAEHHLLTGLGDNQLKELAEIGLTIEKYFRKPQDIEFAFDRKKDPVILQARQLQVQPSGIPRANDLAAILGRFPVLIRNQGEIAQKGIATGPVFFMTNDTPFSAVPNGAVVVTRYASPHMAKIMPKISAFLSDVGSTTGHLATIAREFRVPCILNIGNVTSLLSQGKDVTVDADLNIVYDGRVDELNLYDLDDETIEESTEYRLLRRILATIAPLHLVDPSVREFSPENCRTMHDIIRFVHEKAVEELINQNFFHQSGHKTKAEKLHWHIPLDLVMIDIDDGIGKSSSGHKLQPGDIRSTPMQAILQGLAHPDGWNNDPTSIDMGSFMASLSRTFSPELTTPKSLGMNLVVVSRDYTNLSLRLGYHFTLIDSYVSDEIRNNYAYFRFFGGVSGATRRCRRVHFLAEVLSSHDFRVETHGDLLVGRLKKIDKPGMLERLFLLGLLIGFTRQLDVKMSSDRTVEEYVRKFQEIWRSNNEDTTQDVHSDTGR